ncbi:DNA-binding response regulator [Cytophagales bacterium WSM2-2]|nr:DNA-binding response regulator [Cytophagales bacterium WSM2-2]
MTEPVRLKCIAVDDEPFALKLMEEEIRKVSFLEFIAACSSAEMAKPHIQSGIDLLFLDIQMPNMTGTQFLKTLKNPPMVIITTAYEQYALEGFELDVVDYLLKPVLLGRFLKAVTKAHELFELRQSSRSKSSFFFVRSNYKEIKLFSDDVLYIEGLKDYVKIFTTSQSRAILTRQNLKGMENILPPGSFFRIHHSFIVNVNKITTFQKSQVFIGKTAIPIGEKFAAAFEEHYRDQRN